MNDFDGVVERVLLANGVSPKALLMDYYMDLSRRAKTASLNSEYKITFHRVAAMPFSFIYDIAKWLKMSLFDLVKLFKNSKVIAFFSKIGWSFKKLYGLLKQGVKLWSDLQKVVAKFIAESKVGRWTEEQLKKLDKWLEDHPLIKRYGGYAFAALLAYLWFKASYTGDTQFDFDVADIVAALSGSYSFSSVFGGVDGVRFLITIMTGFASDASFPWPGPTEIHFGVLIILALANKVRVHLKKEKPQNIDQEAAQLGIT